jgi:hypothetical protein
MFENHLVSRSVIRPAGSALVAAALVFGLQGPAAAAECKGMEKARCEGSNSCVWVDSYKRKDGARVDGYCRSKGKKKSGSSDSSKSSS